VLKNRALRRDPVFCGSCECSPMAEQAALSKMPHALADGRMLVLQHPVKAHFHTETLAVCESKVKISIGRPRAGPFFSIIELHNLDSYIETRRRVNQALPCPR
jgi:hypothetical protein